MSQKINRQWRLAARPTGLIKKSDFEWHEEPVPSPGENELLVRNIYLSLDPANRGWVSGAGSYRAPVEIGEVMAGGTLGVVEASQNPRFREGDLVQGTLGWQEYALSNGKGLVPLAQYDNVPLTAYMGLLGHIGLSAYFGLLDIGRPQEGETLVVSAAAGAVGSLVGQIGKIKGCRVVGIAGTDEKCQWLTEQLGFDAAINYKTEVVWKSLKQQCPDGIDVYFDNVGGEILEAALARINLKARVVLCGMISQYNTTERVPGPYNLSRLITQRARMEGFLVTDYFKRNGEAIRDLAQWLAQGKIQYRVDVVEGLEKAPVAINKLFDGSNKGKLIVKISEEPSR